MRKLQTVALTVAIAVSAGSFCVSNAAPAAEVTAEEAEEAEEKPKRKRTRKS